jgi:hypothetical protein
LKSPAKPTTLISVNLILELNVSYSTPRGGEGPSLIVWKSLYGKIFPASGRHFPNWEQTYNLRHRFFLEAVEWSTRDSHWQVLESA